MRMMECFLFLADFFFLGPCTIYCSGKLGGGGGGVAVQSSFFFFFFSFCL